MNQFRCLLTGSLLSLAAGLSACQYDIDKIYEHARDAGADSAVEPAPEHLIDLWADQGISEACRSCALQRCEVQNTECRNDPECVKLTRCVAKTQDPAGQVDCRARQFDWLSEQIVERDTGGPYQQCVFLNECTAPCEARTQLACAGNYTWPNSIASSVKARFRFLEGLAGAPTGGISVKVCRSENALACQTNAEPAFTDDNGEVELELPVTLGVFTGYLELEGGGIYPTLLRFGWPITKDIVTSVTVVNDESARGIVLTSGVKFEPGRGQLQLRMFGCNFIPQRGVSFSVEGADSGIKSWYTQGLERLPVFTLTETSDRGAGGIVNVPGGNARIIAKRGDEVISTVPAPVREGYLTVVFVLPGDTNVLP